MGNHWPQTPSSPPKFSLFSHKKDGWEHSQKGAKEGRVWGEHREEEVVQRNGLNPTGEPRATPKNSEERKRCPDGSRAGQQGWMQMQGWG